MDYKLIEYTEDYVLGRIMPNGEWVAYTIEELSELVLVARAECTELSDRVIDWISVDDRMPVDCSYVVCRCVGIHPFVDVLFWNDDCWVRDGSEITDFQVTHWQPLPDLLTFKS